MIINLPQIEILTNKVDDLKKQIQLLMDLYNEESFQIKKLVSRVEAAEMLGLSVAMIDKLARKGDLTRIKIASTTRFEITEIEELIERRKGH